MFDSRRKSSKSFFFSFSPEFRGVQLGEELVLKLNSPGPCYLKIHHPFLVAFYFIDSTGRERKNKNLKTNPTDDLQH
jgi:hypothetical protein